jgi:flavin-dependent dehydrogenase
MSWFRENRIPHTEIRTLRMLASDGYAGELALRSPIHVFSRKILDTSLREAARCAGARFVSARALKLAHNDGGWEITTRSQTHAIDFLVGADGAGSSVRAAVTGKFAAADLSLALGFYLPGLYHQDTVITAFQENGFRGYLWSFPRVDHSSVGILRWLPETNASDLKQRVAKFIAARYPEAGNEPRFYAARIPCLSRKRLFEQRVCGQDWALLGDAAGFADAITAEGIYFALRSAELLAASLERGNPLLYENAWRSDFGAELATAAAWRDNFYQGRLLGRPFTRRAIQITRHSATVRNLEDRFVSGRLTYNALRRNLILASPRILAEAWQSKRRANKKLTNDE